MDTTCKHENSVIDEHEGTTVCPDCAHVIDIYLFHDAKHSEKIVNKPLERDAMEILQRLNLPDDIIYRSKDLKSIANLYSTINSTSIVTLKEFCAASGIPQKKIVKTNKERICKTKMDELVEKYCTLLDISYKECTLIKEKINSKPYSGHPPLTILAYELYTFLHTTKKIKTTIKKICNIVGISPISIQRYKKYEFSHRC